MDRKSDLFDIPTKLAWLLYANVKSAPLPLLFLLLVSTVLSGLALIYLALFILAPVPRDPLPSEKKYITTTPAGKPSSPIPLPSWHDAWAANRKKAEQAGKYSEQHAGQVEDAEVAMSVVVPAYNEEERLEGMLEEAVAFLDAEYGRPLASSSKTKSNGHATGAMPTSNSKSAQKRGSKNATQTGPRGYEILLIDDGSTDKTVDVALRFSMKHQLHDVLRIVILEENRGKGGAVTHGFRHVRGQYAIFVDADGASTFSDISKLIEGCHEVQDEPRRGIAVGSRAHMVGSEAVIKRSALRNALMHSFHLLLRLLTPPATSRIRDTQCGFKLFSRATLPHIIPYMHAEGWIFDVEMLMLAESAPLPPPASTSAMASTTSRNNGPGIRVKEVPIGWREVGGSKLNVLWDSIGMAWGLAVLRASWMVGVYRRR